MIQNSELILNPDGSLYHINLKPENIAHDIIFVGDQERVEKITNRFEKIEFTTQKREFKTQTGYYKGKRQPEIVKYFHEAIDVRSNWATEIEWNLKK